MDLTRAERNAAFAQWYLHGRHRMLWRIPLSITLVFFVALMLLRRTAEDPHINRVKSRAELEKYVREVPDERNAFVALRAAYGALTKGEPDYDNLDDPATVAHWTCNQEVVQSMQKALELPDATTGFNMFKPGGTGGFDTLYFIIDQFVLDLRMRDRRGDAYLRDREQAAQSLAAIFRISDLLQRDNLSVLTHSPETIASRALHSLYGILSQMPPRDDATLALYQRVLPMPRDPYPLLVENLTQERAYILYHTDDGYSGRSGNAMSQPMETSSVLVYGSDRSCLNGVYSEVIDCYRRRALPEPVRNIIARHQRGPALVSTLVLPRLEENTRFLFETEDQLRLLRLAIAVCRFQQRHKRDPASVVDLVPDFIPRVPEDAYGGKRIRMKYLNPDLEQGTAFVETTFAGEMNLFDHPDLRLMLYTFGPNRIDNEGNSRRSASHESDDTSLLLPLYQPARPEGPK